MLIAKPIKLSIRKNDQVQVIAGKEKSKTGKVLKVDLKSGRVFVEKVNFVKRHVRPNQKNPQGGVIQKEQSLHYSNVLLLCPKCNRGVRHGQKWIDIDMAKAKKTAKAGSKSEGLKKVKVRFCKRCNENLDAA